MAKKKRRITHHVDKRILMRARIFSVISLIFVIILIRDLFIGSISLAVLLIALVAGIFAGIAASRMYHLSWSHDGKKVIGRLDSVGIIVLLLYIIFAIFRQRIVGIFVHGPVLGAATVAVMTGLFIGQIVGIRNGVRGILKDEGIIKDK